MDLSARRQAQQRVDRIRAFREELSELERERGLELTPEQRAGLEAHHQRLLAELTTRFDVDATAAGKRISWGLRIASLLGGAAFCAALVLFLHRVWGTLPAFTYPWILAAIPLLLLAGAELGFRRGIQPYFLALLGTTACGAFILELNALGSVFNLLPSPHAFLAWGGFAILVGYAYGLRLPLAAGLLQLCAYAAALGVSAQGGICSNLFDRPEWFLPAAALCYAAPSLHGGCDRDDFGFVFRACGAIAAFVPLLVLSFSGYHSLLPWSGRTLETIYQLAGLGVSAGVAFHGFRLGRSGLVNLGALAFVVFLYVKLHAWWWAWMPKYLFFLLIGLIFLLLLFLFRRLRPGLPRRTPP
jgi:hypothetical protein